MAKTIWHHLAYALLVMSCMAALMTVQGWYTGSSYGWQLAGFVFVVILSGTGLTISHQTAEPVPLKTKGLVFLFGVLLIAAAAIARACYLRVPLVAHDYRAFNISLLCYNVLLAPFAEETIYRQLFYHDWLAKVNPWLGRIVVGFIFILMHFPTNAATWFFYTVATCSLFIVYEQTGHDLKWPIGLHLLNNVLVLI